MSRHDGPSFDDTAEVGVEPTGRYQAARRPVIEVGDVWKVYSTGTLEVAALRGVSLRNETGE